MCLTTAGGGTRPSGTLSPIVVLETLDQAAAESATGRMKPLPWKTQLEDEKPLEPPLTYG
jgi:hypothetical protein